MFLSRMCFGLTLVLGLGTVRLPASCYWPTYPSCSWSILNSKGANIKGLILSTNDIIYKYWDGRYDPNIKPELSVDEINTLIDFIAAMESEDFFNSVPRSVSSLSQMLKDNLKSLCVGEFTYSDINERKKYYDFFYKNPYVDNEKEMDQTYLNGVNRWYNELKQRQEGEKRRFQNKPSSKDQQAVGQQISQDNPQNTVSLQELITSMRTIQAEVDRLSQLLGGLFVNLSRVVGNQLIPSNQNNPEPVVQNHSSKPEDEPQESK